MGPAQARTPAHQPGYGPAPQTQAKPVFSPSMAHQLPELPYSLDALEPHISRNTLEFHYGKHHAAYVTNLNNLVAGTDLEAKGLEDTILAVAGDASKAGIFNNAAQVWNHSFYWQGIKPNGGGQPTGALAARIDADFGSFDAFKEQFKAAGATQFGSGWAWLVLDNGVLKITKTPNADLPLAHGQKALLTMDVWEHAYYLDYQNRRPDYMTTFLDKLVNWDFVAANLAAG
jgi:Fe-Mn family superoxide dismutase